MKPIAPRLLPWLLLCLALGAQAADDAPVEAAPPVKDTTRWEGAIGANVSYAPEYQGAGTTRLKLSPGFFLRYGRFSITNSSGYVTRRADDVVRGLGVDLSRSDRVKLNLALRFDGGRSENTAAALQGLGDVKPTVRARASATWRFDGGWRTGLSWSIDAFGRGGGNFGDVSVARELRWSPDTVWSWGASVSAAGDRYLQTYYGISEAQAARTGYPVYQPHAGLRDAAAFVNMRSELDARWVVLGGVGVSRLLGPAAASPIVKHVNGWGFNAGLAWRF